MSISFHRFRSFGRGPVSTRRHLRGGFTLIELIVVISIMLVITSFFLLRQQQFNSSTVLRSLAYSVALSVRQSQVYGTSVREFGGGFTAKSYGINFNTGNLAETPVRYILFADFNNNGVYNSGGSPGEFVQDFKLGSGYTIVKFCGVGNLAGTIQSCSSGGVGGGTSISALNTYFIRPNLDANFRSCSDAACTTPTAETYIGAYMQIRAPGGATRNIIIGTTGRIAVCGLNTVYPAC
ncbi:type II secretion system protein [Acetobacteraceae bacterium]|nr:type II secretion system protein [Candidatus Parcubacteria bacterium]